MANKDLEAYFNKWAVKLFKQGDLQVEGFDYEVEDGKLVCKGGLYNLYKVYGIDER